MSDNDTAVDTGDADVAAVETEAKALGWSPKENWRGSEADWVDAQTFVERGRQVMPLLKKNNERLTGKLTETEQQLHAQANELKAVKATLKLLEEHREADVEAQVKDRITKLRGSIAEASRDGDHERVADLTDQLAEERARGAVAAAAKTDVEEESSTTSAVQLPPDIKNWYAENPVYLTDIKRRALGSAIAMELRRNGETAQGAPFLELVKREVEESLNPTPTGGKVAGGNGGGSRIDTPASGGKSYRDLPKEAKEQCQKYETRFVGADKRFKTSAEWQADYAKNYFAQE
jgi:hypothetical protein